MVVPAGRFGEMLSIRVLTKTERESVCMGEIGVGGKFCVEPSCTIEAHKEKKMDDDPQVVSESESYVFIALSDTTLLKN